MATIVEEIATKSASLPAALQHEVLDFVDLVAGRAGSVKSTPFRTVRGSLKMDLSNLDKDLAEIRREMWRNFPREDSE